MDDEKIMFRDLSTPLKILVVLGWILTIFYIVAFFIGFGMGLA